MLVVLSVVDADDDGGFDNAEGGYVCHGLLRERRENK